MFVNIILEVRSHYKNIDKLSRININRIRFSQKIIVHWFIIKNITYLTYNRRYLPLKLSSVVIFNKTRTYTINCKNKRHYNKLRLFEIRPISTRDEAVINFPSNKWAIILIPLQASVFCLCHVPNIPLQNLQRDCSLTFKYFGAYNCF